MIFSLYTVSLILSSLFYSCVKDALPVPAKTTISTSSTSPSTATQTVASVLTSTNGSVLHEEWTNVSGNDINEIPLSTTPNVKSALATLELSSSNTPNTADRMRGYITPPVTGKYTFWISGDDAGQLWLSSDTSPANAVQIAGFLSWTNFHEWNKFSSQKSAQISLKAGVKYFIQVLHKQGGGAGNVSVQLQLPNGAYESPVASSHLTAYIPPATTITPFATSNAISLTNAHNITISGKYIAGGLKPCIFLSNCHDIHITANKLCNSTDVAIHLYKCFNITIDNNYITKVSSGVYAEQTNAGGIVVASNQFLNMIGPFPRGQFVQFNNVRGAGNSISNNKGENIFGQSYPEDAISLYQSSGTPNSPILVNSNWIRGGGPSSSGGGIMLGDEGGSYETASNNILVNPGQYGMAIAGGDHNSIINNSIFGTTQYFTNVGLYVNPINGYKISSSVVTGNKVLFYNSKKYENNVWLAPSAAKPNGWDTSNIWGAKITASILPSTIISAQ